ncbi:hypothetical protein AB0C65_07700 [Nocardia sp. NPDC048505]|uniref:hypothetical protein n=1 Tax=Nocardia sp. NPDC048505 TaxID=3155756 RepID=UPI0033F37DC4
MQRRKARRGRDQITTTAAGWGPPRIVELVGYAFLVAGWVAMALGLWSTPAPDTAYVLDTNDQFVALFYVYGPLFAVLAPGLLFVGVRVVRNRVDSWVLVGAGLTLGLYTQLVATLRFLTDRRPDLPGYIDVSLICTAVACAAALAAVFVRRWPSRSYPLWIAVTLVVAVTAVGPLIASHGERMGPVGLLSAHPECGLTMPDWVDADGTAVYTGTVEAGYRPDTRGKPASMGPVLVTVTLADGRMTTAISPDNPAAMADTSELRRKSRSFVTSTQHAEVRVYSRMSSPECDHGTRVTAVTFSGTAAKNDAEGRPVDLHHIDGKLTRVVD